jgi:hypothetical protein
MEVHGITSRSVVNIKISAILTLEQLAQLLDSLLRCFFEVLVGLNNEQGQARLHGEIGMVSRLMVTIRKTNIGYKEELTMGIVVDFEYV